jgi:hypothetical protein
MQMGNITTFIIEVSIENRHLPTFPWSSHPSYLGAMSAIVDQDAVAKLRQLVPDYETFITDQTSYTRELEKIKHLTFEHD